ncbi:MAG: DNA polymerase III subunit [Dehalococcoidia bacterium]|nr:DNA polymerase III subunit [Dehalococcoidia bacterium]
MTCSGWTTAGPEHKYPDKTSPMWQVIGQPKAIKLFEQALQTGSLAHAYLLVGPPRVGKGTLAINLAQALNCTGAAPPCGQCSPCLRIAQAKHADVKTIRLDDSDGDDRAHQEISTEDIKELQYFASLPPYEGRYRVFIIDGAENMSAEASNRILKVLEEPLPHVVWLLLVVEEARILPTVASRCQRVGLRPVAAGEVARLLQEHHGLDGTKAELLARLSAGCPGWAVSAAGDGRLLEERSRRLGALVDLIATGLNDRLQAALELSRGVEKNRRAAVELLKGWLGFWRDVLLVKNACDAGVVNIDYLATMSQLASSLSLAEIKRVVDQLNEAIDQIGRNANTQLVLEVLFLNLPYCPVGPLPARDGA